MTVSEHLLEGEEQIKNACQNLKLLSGIMSSFGGEAVPPRVPLLARYMPDNPQFVSLFKIYDDKLEMRMILPDSAVVF